jgi:hypothetical protein
MTTGSAFRTGRPRVTRVVLRAAVLLLVLGGALGGPAGGQDRSAQPSTTTVRGIVVDERTFPRSDILIRCADAAAPDVSLGETLSGAQGDFTLTVAAVTATLRCWVGDDQTYLLDEKGLTAGRDAEVVFTARYATIPELVGWIQIPKDWEIHKALVQLTQSNGIVMSQRPDDEGKVVFRQVKAGPAELEYSFDGLETTRVRRVLAPGSDLSASLRFDWFPSALLLLVPGIGVLALFAGVHGRRDGTDPAGGRRDRALMVASLLLWGATFSLFWWLLKSRGGEGLHFFHPKLSFALSVPIFGFMGALIFVIDLLRTGSQAVPAYREFALRLVLGPYVAIVMVLLFGGTFDIISLDKLGSQATVAFFSGFLVVLVLQSLAEKGNEVLGHWRATSRYDPSEIAGRFHLQVEDDVKLQKANLKYLDQLRTLSTDELRMIGKQTQLGEDYLVGLQQRLREADLAATLGEETWAKLHQEGVRTVGDVALLAPERLEQVAAAQHLDRVALTVFREDCHRAFAGGACPPSSPPFRPAAVGTVDDRQN